MRSSNKALVSPDWSQATIDRLAAEIKMLEQHGLNELRARWLKVTGRAAPKAFRTEMLRRALAYEMQVAAFGGLPTPLKRRLRELAIAAREDKFDEALGRTSLKPGTTLVRLWQGRSETVMVLQDGYAWNAESYASLSAVAKAITGTNWNGWTFFGVKRPSGRNKNAAGPRNGGGVASGTRKTPGLSQSTRSPDLNESLRNG